MIPVSSPLTQVLDAGWRAALGVLHPRVIGWSLAPLLLAVVLSGVAMWWLWEPAVAGARAFLESWLLIDALLQWLDTIGANGFRSVLAPLVVMAVALPVVMALSLLLVAAFMTPALARWVAGRRFPGLEARRGGTVLGGVLWGLGSLAVALVVLLVSLPFWLIPPVVRVVPPLVWGWLSTRVFSYDVLAEFASVEERHRLMREHRWPLLGMGVVCGYLGAAPSMLFAFGALNLMLAPLLLPLAIWLYTWVFALAALWFAHYALAALQRLRSAPVVLDV